MTHHDPAFERRENAPLGPPSTSCLQTSGDRETHVNSDLIWTNKIGYLALFNIQWPMADTMDVPWRSEDERLSCVWTKHACFLEVTLFGVA